MNYEKSWTQPGEGFFKKDDLDEAFSGKKASGKDIAKKMMKYDTMQGFASKVAKIKMVSAKDLDKLLPDYVSGGDIAKLFEVTNPFGLFSGKAGFNKANIEMEKTLKQAYQQKTFQKAKEMMAKVQQKYSKLGATDTEPDEIIHQLLNKHFKTTFSRT